LTLIDCGLFQGGRQTELRNFNTELYRPGEVRAIVITHAHMDHSGLVPRLVKSGYRGPVYASGPTCELLEILWRDAAHIQEQEAVWKSRKNKRQGQRTVEPLYTEEDALLAGTLLHPLPPDEPFELQPDLSVTLLAAGHILGAVSVLAEARTGGRTERVLFSGDLGRRGQLLIPDPAVPPASGRMFMETTYGSRLLKDLDQSAEELARVINQAVRLGGKVLIPAFAVERTQEILFLLSTMWHTGTIAKNIPIILDSPLAVEASRVYVRNQHLLDSETRSLIGRGLSPLTMSDFKITSTMEESQKINDITGPAVIVAGSGMGNAGRILHHFKHNLWRESCQVIFVGFQAQGTTGRRLVDGAQTVKIFREAVAVKAKIHTIGGFSGHADQAELTEWLRPQIHPCLKVVLVHGEESGTLIFQEHLKKLFPDLETLVPRWRQVLEAGGPSEETRPETQPEAGPEPAKTYPALAQSFQERLDRLSALMAERETSLDPARLAGLESCLNQAEEIILEP
jgi:metallo-beta-lactamase family protein